MKAVSALLRDRFGSVADDPSNGARYRRMRLPMLRNSGSVCSVGRWSSRLDMGITHPRLLALTPEMIGSPSRS